MVVIIKFMCDLSLLCFPCSNNNGYTEGKDFSGRNMMLKDQRTWQIAKWRYPPAEYVNELRCNPGFSLLTKLALWRLFFQHIETHTIHQKRKCFNAILNVSNAAILLLSLTWIIIQPIFLISTHFSAKILIADSFSQALY